MKSILFLLSLLTLGSSVNAAVTHLSPEHRKLLVPQPAFHAIETSQVPLTVVSLCADSNGRMAAPGKPWEATDVIADNLPRKRFIWAANYSNLYLLHYERGGIAHSFHIALAKVGMNRPGIPGDSIL